MSQPNKKQSIFLLGKLTLMDYLLVVAVIALFAVTFLLVPGMKELWNTLETTLGPAPRVVPARSIQTTHNASYLWNKDDYIVPNVESTGSLFFSPGNQILVFPATDISTNTYTLEAIDVMNGQTLWQTSIARPSMIRIYEGKFVVLSAVWLDQAPTKNNRELPYCSFDQRRYSISTYDISTGQNRWSYGYRGMNIPNLTFENQSMYLAGTDHHGKSGLLINVDMNTGFIIDQRCARIGDGNSLPSFPKFSQGIYGTTFEPTSIEAQATEGCGKDNQYCFVTEGNRLHILNGGAKDFLGYIDFGGSLLTSHYIDILILNKIGVIHLDDSDQLFAFRLP
ncbi:MAG: hypothetical protein IAE79_09335 [Anaerolinea sp.]|nr:hypothetical protein [Anaerolinea sp.]